MIIIVYVDFSFFSQNSSIFSFVIENKEGINQIINNNNLNDIYKTMKKFTAKMRPNNDISKSNTFE